MLRLDLPLPSPGMKAAAGRQVELRSFGDAGAAAGAGGEDGLQHTRLLGGDEEDGGGHEEHGDHEHLSSNTRAFVNTFISFVGAGMLSLPFAFRQAGWLLCLFALLGVAALCTYCMVLLVECKYMLKSKGAVTYGDVVWHALGLPGLIAVEVSLVITQAGFSTAYLVFIGRNLNQLFDLPEDPVILACLPALVALCLLRHLKYLAPFSLIAECVNLTGLLVVYAVDFEYMHVNHPSVEWANWASLPFALGVCLYCFEGMGMTLSLEGSMLKKHDFIPVLSWVMLVYSGLCATTGIFGYLAFGSETADIILLNMGQSMGSNVVKLSFVVGLYFTYPVMMHPCWQIVEKWLDSSSSSYNHRRNIMRAGGVLLTGCIAAGVDNFGTFISLVGSSCCSLLALILPPMAHSFLQKREGQLHLGRGVVHAFISSVGVVIAITGTADALRKIALGQPQ